MRSLDAKLAIGGGVVAGASFFGSMYAIHEFDPDVDISALKILFWIGLITCLGGGGSYIGRKLRGG